MTAERRGDDYWRNEFDLGTLSTWTFRGEDGLGRLSGPSRVTADDPAAFRASLSRVQLDHVAIEAVASSPHRATRGRAEIERHPTPLMAAILLVDGRLEIEQGGAMFPLSAGEHMIADSRVPMTVTSRTDTRVLQGVVGIEHVPDYLRHETGALVRALPRTRLTDSYFEFISGILRSGDGGHRVRGDHLVAAIADLHAAVLAEARQVVGYPEGAVGLRYRMEEFVETHLSDPGLTPTAVAEAVGISERRAHQVFNDDERTIARFIRDRRLSAVARELRDAVAPLRLASLHHRHGFSSHDVLGRAFRHRFGMSLTEYRDEGHRHLG